MIFKSLLTRDEPESNIILKDIISSITKHKVDLYSSQGVKGKDGYKKLAKTYQVNFLDFQLFKNDIDYFNHFQLMNNKGNVFSKNVNTIIIELPKLERILNKPIEKFSSLEMWGIFIKYINNNKMRELLNKIIDKKEEIAMAKTLLQTISNDQYERARLLSRRKFQNDMYSDLATATEKGRLAGIREGKKAERKKAEAIINKEKQKSEIEKIEAVKKLIKMNLSNDQISEALNLPSNIIEKLRISENQR